MRGLSSILTKGKILLLDLFDFHVVKPLIPTLALLPTLCIYGKLERSFVDSIPEFAYKKAARDSLDDLGEPVDAFGEAQCFVSMFRTNHSGKSV